MIQSFQRMNVNKKYLKYRPSVPIRGNSKAWWDYAFTSVAESYIRPYSWERIKQHRFVFASNSLAIFCNRISFLNIFFIFLYFLGFRQYYRQYKNLYKQKLLKPNDAEIKMDLQKMEDHLDVANILLAREHAKLEVSRRMLILLSHADEF